MSDRKEKYVVLDEDGNEVTRCHTLEEAKSELMVALEHDNPAQNYTVAEIIPFTISFSFEDKDV